MLNFFKSQFIYVLLALTLAASAYFAYLDNVDTDAEVLEPEVNKEVMHNSKQAMPLATANIDGKMIDIFATYKKPQEASKHVKITQPSTTLKILPTITQSTVSKEPTLPLIPFKYIGKLFDGEVYQIFFSMSGKGLLVEEGDIIQKDYKVEKISPPTMTLTYMPTNTSLIMQIGDFN